MSTHKVCPGLGSVYDRSSHKNFANPLHNCYIQTKPAAIGLDHQETFCLTENYENCPIYQRETQLNPIEASENLKPEKRSFNLSFVQSLSLITRGHRNISVDLTAFLQDPNHWLTTVSELDDRFRTFRRLTFFTLLIGFPVLLYALVYGIVRWISTLFMTGIRATWTASGICLGVGIVLLIPVALGQSIAIAIEDIDTVFKTGTRVQRVAAMQRIEREQMDIARASPCVSDG